MTIRLTADLPGNPPVLLNPAHVVSVEARKRTTPHMASQKAELVTSYIGSRVRVVTGEQHVVLEQVADIDDMIKKALGTTEIDLTPKTPQPQHPVLTSETPSATAGEQVSVPGDDSGVPPKKPVPSNPAKRESGKAQAQPEEIPSAAQAEEDNLKGEHL